jgi:hypothetical protein
MSSRSFIVGAALSSFAVALFAATAPLTAQNENDRNAANPNEATTASQTAVPPKLPEPKGAKRLSPDYDAWIDPKQKAVLVDGQISLREGMLEMFACTRNTKEHESIVAANTKAFLVHAALLALGAVPGEPVQFVPRYRPPSGTQIDITVMWLDERGKQRTVKAQDWIKNIETGKPMTHPFVFAGSFFRVDEETGKKYYQAERGDFICVSNFSTAMLDVPAESSPTEAELMFEAFTERIPPLGAPVRLILKPRLKSDEAAGKAPGTKSRGEIENGAAQSEASNPQRNSSP